MLSMYNNIPSRPTTPIVMYKNTLHHYTCVGRVIISHNIYYVTTEWLPYSPEKQNISVHSFVYGRSSEFDNISRGGDPSSAYRVDVSHNQSYFYVHETKQTLLSVRYCQKFLTRMMIDHNPIPPARPRQPSAQPLRVIY